MKNKIKLVIAFLVLSIMSQAQSFKEKISKTLNFEKKSPANTLMVYNISGTVSIEGNTSDQINVEVNKSIEAKTNERLEIGKSEVQLGIIDRADTIILYVKGTGHDFTNKKWGKSGNNEWGYHRGWDGQWHGRGEDVPYDYKMDFTIKVPAGIHIVASAINDGDVFVKNIKGNVKARNINGDIKLEKLSAGTDAHTINGDVDIDYDKNPMTDCRYYSLNGHVNVNFPSSLSGTMSFKSFNGDLFTNVDNLETLPPLITKNENNKGTRYKIEMQRFKIRSGGPHFEVETFNGDATIKENQK